MEELYHLQNCELAMGEYYQRLAERFPLERLFWEEAICDEVNHARTVGRLIALVSSDPQSYRQGKYRVAVLETFLAGIYEQIDLLRQGSLSTQEILKIAYDYEGSAIMSKPYDIVDSSEVKFYDLRQKFADDAESHCDRIRQYIAQKLGIQNKTSHLKLQETAHTLAAHHHHH